MLDQLEKLKLIDLKKNENYNKYYEITKKGFDIANLINNSQTHTLDINK